MPAVSDRKIGNAPCRSQICAQDPDSWPEAAARQRLHWASSARPRWWNFLVQGHHCWWELDLRLRPWDKATILPVENLHVTKAKKGHTGEKQSQEHDHHFLWHQGDFAQRICPNRPNCEFRVLLLSFAETAWKSAKISPPNFGENRPGCFTMTTLSSSPTSFWRKTKLLLSPTHRNPLIWHPMTSSYFQKWNWSWKDAGSIPLRRYRPNRRECLTLKQKRTSRKRSKNGGDGGTGVYMREGTTSRVTAAERPYGEFCDFYSVSLVNFGSTLI